MGSASPWRRFMRWLRVLEWIARQDAARSRAWSWDDPMTPPVYVIFVLGVALGAILTGIAWVAS